ncbi:tRNA (guanosine-2'-O-)-methyltransferase [Thermotomaculum hydrothermale]|uniref:tRNA (guanosine(18)-2'-O)-methyltransferase n=1 Tax=Thermotomaculum hydrothermale TaxID=981385 RepID=A0A7R6PZF5_9BACT|nr:RNA methyltransferase [Thermotomaculum hydrothermale]BBB32563.1 tRNA (guanosine-2'-O-)-methyltransferase [Thermotomaculum hydrothermale]
MEKEIRFLESLLSEKRLNRIKQVINNKIENITVVLDNLLDSHNTSAIIRTAEGLGLKDIYIIEKDYEFEINKAVTKYSHKWVELHRYKDFTPCVKDLKEKGYKIFVANVGEKSVKLTDIEITPENKYAFVVGNEHDGISDEMLKYADCEFTIPMYGFTESFNVSVACAIILSYTIYKYRNALNKPSDLSENEKQKIYFDFLKKAVKNSDVLLKSFKKRENKS